MLSLVITGTTCPALHACGDGEVNAGHIDVERLVSDVRRAGASEGL